MKTETTIWGLISASAVVAILVLLKQEGYFDSDDSITNVAENEESVTIYSSADELHPLATACLNHAGLSVHIHPIVRIEINGSDVEIPTSLGVNTATCFDDNNMHVTHTHDSTGKIHVELNEPADVPLAVLFDVWGKHFDSTGILDERIADDYVLSMTVDGVSSDEFENHSLADGQDIVIVFGSSS